MELKPEERYTLLYNLETKLRQLIERTLSVTSRDWWVESIPWRVRDRVEKRRKRKELAPWFKVRFVKLSPVNYLDLKDYLEIMTKPHNWKRFFQNIFKDEDFIIKRLELLKKIRNKVMHFQPLLSKENMLLNKYVEEILEKIENWETINLRYAHPAEEAILTGKLDKAIQILNDGLMQTRANGIFRGDPWLAFFMGRVLEELRKYNEAADWYLYASEKLAIPQYRKMAEERLIEIQKKKELIEVICPNCEYKFKIKDDCYDKV